MSQTSKQSYPTRTMRNIGDIMFIKQKGDETRPELALWDYVRQCSGDCPIRHICPATSELCTPEKEYLQHVIRLIFEYEDKKMIDRHGLHVFGTAILPMYQQLFLFKIEAMGLSSPVLEGKFISIHPIYKEIRATIKMITSLWGTIGIKSAAVPDPAVTPAGKAAPADVDYYELVQATRDVSDTEETEEEGEDINPRTPVDPDVDPPKPRSKHTGSPPAGVAALIAAAQTINKDEADIMRAEQEINEAVTLHSNFKGSTGLQHRKGTS